MGFFSQKKKNGEKEMSFLQHLEELRWHIVRSVAAIVIMAIVAFIFKDILFNKIILAPRNPEFFTNRVLCHLGDLLNTTLLCINTKPFNLININMSGQFSTHVTVSVIAGIVLAFPFIIWEFWKFFKPALLSNEKKYAGISVLAASIMFFLGVAFGYYMIVPFSLSFLGSYEVSSEIVNQINVMSYIKTVTQIALASGLIFELPIVAFFLTKIGVITPAFMKKYRKHAIVVIFIIGAIITPPDVISQTLVSVPLVGLYEFSILISKSVVRRREKEEAKLKTENS
jgi:sec-independent protein translocase protein TatC